ncbi:unnamed protein product [Phytomonas sp. EM1]|nr:unnamed protein product [Phytomonas sp. EM1]|eukprot:CCW65831.1 unnamed protein product [Phytomonas sp. isolate EM1]
MTYTILHFMILTRALGVEKIKLNATVGLSHSTNGFIAILRHLLNHVNQLGYFLGKILMKPETTSNSGSNRK